MVVPSHPIDRTIFAGLDIEGNYQTDLFFRGVTDWNRPGILLPLHIIDRLFVGEQDITVEAFLARGKITGAEPLETSTAWNDE